MTSARGEFNHDLELLLQDTKAMGKAAGKALVDSVNALLSGNDALAREVIQGDDNIDLMQVLIEDKSILLIALQQPLARDLRILTTALKIVTDLERIGDYAENIATIALKVKNRRLIEEYPQLETMAREVLDMLDKVLQAYLDMDMQKAELVHQQDDIIDGIYKTSYDEILNKIQNANGTEEVELFAKILGVLHYLERAGDHATNIAEWVIFLSSGRRYRMK